MHYFYCKNIDNGVVQLDADESRHCARVLRLRVGQDIGVVDGKGVFCRAGLLEVNAKATTANVIEKSENYGKKPFRLHLAVAPTKNIDRFEWLLEKATECGVDEITPLNCEKSERRIIKPQRLEKIMVAAMKQSGRAYQPALNPAITFDDFMKQGVFGLALLAHCSEGKKSGLGDLYEAGNDVLVMIGPEGDFTDREITTAIDKGFKAISLGMHRLRTETAALVACIQVNSINGLL